MRRRRSDSTRRGQRFETLYFAFRNREARRSGSRVVLFFLVLAIVGPWLTDADPFEFGFPLGEPPSTEYWLGTTASGQDVFAQFVYGLRASFIVGALAACVAAVIGMTIGFIGGYLGGVVDDILSMLTNVVLVIPTLAVLIIVAAYLSVGSLAVGGDPDRAHLVAVGGAGDPRADVLARLARVRQPRAPLGPGHGQGDRQRDRAEHELVPLPHVHPPLRRLDPHRRDARLPRPRPLAT